jgi:S1-C subfamily serine protease
VEPDDGSEEEGPFFAWLPPDDRLWRHPSETLGDQPGQAGDAGGSGSGRGGPASGFLSTFSHGPLTRIWTVAVLAGIIGAAAASGLGMVSGVFAARTTVVDPVVPTAPVETVASATVSSVDWTDVDDTIAASIVDIDVTSVSGSASGSGVLFEPGDGVTYVFTDSSLVTGAYKISTTFASGEQYPARVVGNDPISGLALIAVPTAGRDFPQLGSVADLQLASPVLAVGARMSGGGSVFTGAVSAEDLQVNATGGSVIQNLIAVSGPPAMPSTAAGGPLLDEQGHVVGITVSLDPTDATDAGLVLAVPVDVAEHVAQQWLAHKALTHPWLGVTGVVDTSPSVAQQFGLSGGASVGQVWPGSPASRLGLNSNDIITSFDGQQVVSCGALTQLLFSQTTPGRPVTITYLHKGKPVQATVMVRDQPDSD